MHSIGQAAKRSRVNIETIRYYEREGIVPRAELRIPMHPDARSNNIRTAIPTYPDKLTRRL